MKNTAFTILNTTILVILNISCADSGFASDAKYIQENITIINARDPMHVASKETLLDNKKKSIYSIRNLFDNDKKTAWVTRFNEKIPITDVPQIKITFVKPVFIKTITIRNGYQKSKELYYQNQRAKIIILDKTSIGNVSYPYEETTELEDNMSEQTISFDSGSAQAIKLLRTKEVIINVLDIYKGSKYSDLCISDIKIVTSDDIDYEPSVTWRDIKSKIENNAKHDGKMWEWEKLEENEYQLFNDLMFYVLTGNKEAYSLFSTFEPKDEGFKETINSLIRIPVEETLKLEKLTKRI